MAETLLIKTGPDLIKIEVITEPINLNDEYWLDCNIEIKIGGFRGAFSASLQPWDFHHLHLEFKKLHETIQYRFNYGALENQIQFNCIGDNFGHVEIIGSVSDQAGGNNELSFKMQFDQSYLPEIIHQLSKITNMFPHSF